MFASGYFLVPWRSFQARLCLMSSLQTDAFVTKADPSLLKYLVLYSKAKTEKVCQPGFEPGMSRPQREVLTSIPLTPAPSKNRTCDLTLIRRAPYHTELQEQRIMLAAGCFLALTLEAVSLH